MSQVIADFRIKHPQYDAIADDQLVTALHGKYYSSIPIEEFNQKIGYQQQLVHPTQGAVSTDEQGQMVAPQPQQANPISMDARYGELGQIRNRDNTISTEYSITENIPELGGWVNIPTLVKGQADTSFLDGGEMSDQHRDIAINRAMERVNQGASLPAYSSLEEAVSNAEGRTEEEKMRPYSQQKTMGEMVNEKQFIADQQPIQSEAPGFISNTGRGVAERAGDILGGFLSAVNVAAESAESAIPMGGFVWEGGLLPSYKNAEELNAYKQAGGSDVLKDAETGAEGFDVGYIPTHTWEAVKNEFSEGGPLSGSAWGEVVGYVGEQGIKSIPDMAAAVMNLPGYIVARSGEIGDTRAKNKGKEKTDLTDVLEAVPFAVGSAILERIGAKGITQAGAETFGKEALKRGFTEAAKRAVGAGAKAGGKEAITEAVQEGMIEYAGERFGTDAKMSAAEALDLGLAGMVAGGGMGTAAGTVSAGAKEATYSPEKELGKALAENIEGSEFASIEEQARAALSPEMAQVESAREIVAPEIQQAKEVTPSLSTAMDIADKEDIAQAEVLPEVAPGVEKQETLGELDGQKLIEAINKDPEIRGTRERAMVRDTMVAVETGGDSLVRATENMKSYGIDAETVEAVKVSTESKASDDLLKVSQAEDKQIEIKESQRKAVLAGDYKDLTPEYTQWIESLPIEKRQELFAEGSRPAARNAEFMGWSTTDKAAVKTKAKTLAISKMEVPKATDMPLDTMEDFFSEGVTSLSGEYTRIKDKYKGSKLTFTSRDNLVSLDKIIVPSGSRGEGTGTKIMTDIVNLADERGNAIDLIPSSDFGGNKAGLIKFYKSFGFVENKGRNKDYEISGSMYRLPKEKKATKVQPEDGTVIDYGTSAAESFIRFQALISESKITKVEAQKSFDSLVKNKDEVISQLNDMSQKELVKFVRSPKADAPKDQLVTRAYEGMLEAHALNRYSIEVIEGGKTFEEQISEVVKNQTDAEINETLYENDIETGRKQDTPEQKKRAKEIKNEKPPEVAFSIRPTSETGQVYHAPGHNYVGVYRSMGLPPRKELFTIEGRKIKMPSDPQRIEPIMRDLIRIMGRRIYNGKIKGKSVEGFYRSGVGELRTRRKNDVEILAHEMAHYLDMYSNDTLPNFASLYKKKEYRDEVAALSYTDADKKIELTEGFAEFVRLWLTNSNEAQLRAPEFYGAFVKLLATDRKLLNPMRNMQESMHKFYFQGADHLGRALIGKEEGMYGKFMQWTYRRDSLIRQQSIDKMHAAREAEKELTGQVGTVEESAWKQFRIANGGYEGVAEYIMNYGTLKFEENGDLVPNGKGLYQILKPIDTVKLKDKDKDQESIDLLMRYFAGRRALELHRQKRENLIPKETAKVWAKLGRDYPVFESIFKEYQEFNTRMMNLYQDSGMLTPDARTAMEKVNRDYVPFNRLRDSLEGGEGVSSGFHRLKGGTANLEDILVNIQDGVTSNVKAALDARAKQRLYQYIAGHRDGAIWAVKIAPDSKLVKAHLEDMERKIGEVLEASGVVIEGELDLSNPDLINFWQHGVKPKLTESGNFIDTVVVNGKPQYYEVQDPLLQEMLLGMNPESYGSFMNVMFGIKNMFTRTITLGVEFTGANLVRDTIGASFISKNGFIPFIDSFKGMYSFLAKDKHFQDFMRSGGGYSSRVHGTTKAGHARQRIRIKQYGVANKSQKLLSWLDNFMSAFEYGTRIGEFRIAKKNNMSDMDAAFAAREISTDFSVYGSNHFLTGYIRTVPFLNAMIQSQDRVFREAVVFKKFGGNPRALAMKAFLGLTVPTLLLWLINKDDEDYKEIPDYEKRTNWHFPLGDGTFIKMPRPYDVGFIYATMPELFFKYIEDNDGKEYAEGMAWTMLQMYGIDGVPAAAQGMWDILRNKKWTGAPVVSGAMADLSAAQQYNANTSETFIRLGQMLNISPVKAEHVFKAHTGYLGGYLMAGTEKMLWDKDRFGEYPESQLADNIFIKRFITPKTRPNNRSMEKFFDLKEQSDNITADFKAGIDLRRAIKGDTDGKFKDDTFFGLTSEEKAVLFALNDSMNDMIKLIYGKEGMKTKELSIRYDKKLSAEQKREGLDKLWTQRNSVFTRYYTQAKKALDKAKNQPLVKQAEEKRNKQNQKTEK